MTYILHSAAETDIRDAGNYYRERAGLQFSHSFFDAFEHAMRSLAQYPLLGAPWQHNKRRFVMKRFPYAIIYEISTGEIRVLAVAHHSRKPNYWKNRKWPS